MEEISILLTGEYWHSEFSDLIAEVRGHSVTLKKLDSILDEGLTDIRFQLVVVAQPRRSQFSSKQLEALSEQFIHIPVVVLCGSWCEGETRSGTPIPGLTRVYWHQWKGRFENFQDQLISNGVATWHLPKIASITDHIQQDVDVLKKPKLENNIGISALNQESFEMMAMAIHSTGCVWIESLPSSDTNKSKFSVICVEGNSLTEDTERRVRDLQKRFPRTPMVMTLNFPRRSEFAIANRLGIEELVSKPFQLSDLQFAIRRAQSPIAA